MTPEGGDQKNSPRPSNRGGGQTGRRRRPLSTRDSSGRRNTRPPRDEGGSSRPQSSGRNRSRPAQSGPRPGTNRPAPAPAQAAAVPAPPKPFVVDPTTVMLNLSAWDLARTRTAKPDTDRGQIMTLRTHQKLLTAFEDARGVGPEDRSYLRVRDGAVGSCLFVHGVSTGPGDLKELAEEFMEAGYNVYVLRLPDYGTGGSTLGEITWESALAQARQCYQLLARGGGKVHVVGLGFGAALAMHLAALESLSSLVLLAPAIMPRENLVQRMLVRLKLHHVKLLRGWLGWNPDLMEGMDAARGKIGKIKVPIYAAQCEDDDRACPGSLRFLQRKAKNKSSRFQLFPQGGHAILASHGQASLNKDVLRFCGAD